jgi:2'-5' RNA ligase
MTDCVSLPRVAFWLVPRLQERLLLGKIIASFAQQYSSPEFLPHVTLCSCDRSEARQELKLLASLAKSCAPFSMSVEASGSSDRLAQAFFLGLRKCEEAECLSQSFAAEVACAANYSFEPHLSLVYQNLPVAERNKLTTGWSSPLQTICFDQLWAVAIPAQIKTLQDFYGWQPLLACQLDSSLNVDTL